MRFLTVPEVLHRVAEACSLDVYFSGSPATRALVLSLATVLVERESDAALAECVSPVLEVLLPARLKPAPRLHALAQEMARRMLTESPPEAMPSEYVDGLEVVLVVDVDRVTMELWRCAHPNLDTPCPTR